MERIWCFFLLKDQKADKGLALFTYVQIHLFHCGMAPVFSVWLKSLIAPTNMDVRLVGFDNQ